MKNRLIIAAFCLFGVLACNHELGVISVSNITLNSSSVELIAGDSFTLVATVSPYNASNTNVLWTTDNASVATVDNGVILAQSPGKAVISAVSDDGGKTATCKVAVSARIIPVTGITLNTSSLALRVGEWEALEASVQPENATNKNVSWLSTNDNVASVSATGVVQARSAGASVICAITEDGHFEAQCSLVATVAVSGISLNQEEASVDEGGSIILTAVITPEDASDQEILWVSSNPEIATVDAGKVTGIKAGSAVITATSKDGAKTASCVVSVIAHPKSISLNETAIKLERGSLAALEATVLPDNTTDKRIEWTSSDTAVATVYKGFITAVGIGNTTITAQTVDGGLQAECSVTVVVSIASLSVIPNTLELKAGDSSALDLLIFPEDATEREIAWKSSSPSIATVDKGVVTAHKGGTTRISAVADNGVSSCCDVTVTIPVTGISLSPETLVIEQNTSAKISASISPNDATDKTIVWESSSPSVATVSSGTVQALNPGSTVIKATTVDGNYSATCSVTVEKEKTKATSLSFDGPALFVGDGKHYSLRVRVAPEDAVVNCVWSNSNSSAITVNGNGETADIISNYSSTSYSTVKVTDQRTGLSASIKVYSFIKNFAWQENSGETYSGYPLITIAKNGTHQLKYTSDAGSNVLNLFGDYNNFVFYEPTYVVSSPSNISLASDGLVTGVKEGKTGIKATGGIVGGGDRVYFKVVSKLYESEYNDSKDYANNVPYGIPMVFDLMNTSDVDWFKLQTNTTSGYINITITVEYSGASSLSENESRLCKYILYDSTMQQWGSGSFSFSNQHPEASTTRTVPAGPLYLKVYFDSSVSGLLPDYSMTLRLTVD